MDSGHLISKAVFAVQASYAKELTMQPCSLDMGDKYPSLQISRSSSIQVLSNASSDLKTKGREETNDSCSYIWTPL